MQAVFADTFYWIAVTSPRDASRPRALAMASELTASAVSIVTTEEVLTEYLTFFADTAPTARERAARNVERLQQDPDVWIIPQSHESFQAGLTLYKARSDKAYSLTDCISMNTMRQQGLTQALTNDRHFEQEGFRALFRD